MTRTIVYEEPDGNVARVSSSDEDVLLLDTFDTVVTVVYEDEVVQIPVNRVYRGEVSGSDLNSVADQYHPDVLKMKQEREDEAEAEEE